MVSVKLNFDEVWTISHTFGCLSVIPTMRIAIIHHLLPFHQSNLVISNLALEEICLKFCVIWDLASAGLDFVSGLGFVGGYKL